jgi:hypothetical protein
VLSQRGIRHRPDLGTEGGLVRHGQVPQPVPARPWLQGALNPALLPVAADGGGAHREGPRHHAEGRAGVDGAQHPFS